MLRDGRGRLLDRPQVATFLTCAAPNAGACARDRPEELGAIPEVLRGRIPWILALADARGDRSSSSWPGDAGASGMPRASSPFGFAEPLLRGAWVNRFDRVIYSAFDRTPGLDNYSAFRDAFSTS